MVFGSLVDPRENPNSGKPEWNLGFVVSVSDAETIFQAIEQALEEKRSRDLRFPKGNEGLKMPYRPSEKKDETGQKVVDPENLLFSFKRNAQVTTKTGEIKNTTPPSLYDSAGKIVTGTIGGIRGGTTGKVVYEVYVYDRAGSKGVSLQIVGFQIAQLAKDTIELAPIEGGWVSEELDPIAAALMADA